MFIAYRVAQRNCKFYGLNPTPPPGKWKKNSVSACLINGRICASIQYQITMEHKY